MLVPGSLCLDVGPGADLGEARDELDQAPALGSRGFGTPQRLRQQVSGRLNAVEGRPSFLAEPGEPY